MTDINTATLAVVAPARTLLSGVGQAPVDQTRIAQAVTRMQGLGWHVVVAPNVYQLAAGFAGPDDVRANALMQAFDNTDVDLIMPIRGGYGTARILPLLDWARIEQSQAVFMGLSDTTALNCALWSQCAKPSWQGPVVGQFSESDDLRDKRWMKAFETSTYEVSSAAQGAICQVQGRLWGGNLTVLLSLLGTPYFPNITDGILVIEDIGEPAWHIDRMLEQLAQASVLSRQKALLVGDCRGIERYSQDPLGSLMPDVLWQSIEDRFGIPVVRGLEFGHLSAPIPIPIGVMANLESDGTSFVLRAYDCPLPTEVPRMLTTHVPLWWV